MSNDDVVELRGTIGIIPQPLANWITRNRVYIIGGVLALVAFNNATNLIPNEYMHYILGIFAALGFYSGQVPTADLATDKEVVISKQITTPLLRIEELTTHNEP